MEMIRRIFLILLTLVFSLNTFCQGLSPLLSLKLNGIIIDKETRIPLAYVSIGIQG